MMDSARLQIRIGTDDGPSACLTVPSKSGKPCGMLVLIKSGLISHCAGRSASQYLLQGNFVTPTGQTHT